MTCNREWFGHECCVFRSSIICAWEAIRRMGDQQDVYVAVGPLQAVRHSFSLGFKSLKFLQSSFSLIARVIFYGLWKGFCRRFCNKNKFAQWRVGFYKYRLDGIQIMTNNEYTIIIQLCIMFFFFVPFMTAFLDRLRYLSSLNQPARILRL